MANATQFTFSMVEVTETLIKAQGIHEGLWVLNLEYTLNVGLMGITQDQARPGVMVLANSLQLTAVDPKSKPPENLVVDAAIVNPASEK